MNDKLYNILKWINTNPNKKYPECPNMKSYWDLLEELSKRGYVKPWSIERIQIDTAPYGYILQCDKAELEDEWKDFIMKCEQYGEH